MNNVLIKIEQNIHNTIQNSLLNSPLNVLIPGYGITVTQDENVTIKDLYQKS